MQKYYIETENRNVELGNKTPSSQHIIEVIWPASVVVNKVNVVYLSHFFNLKNMCTDPPSNWFETFFIDLYVFVGLFFIILVEPTLIQNMKN